MQKRYRTLQEYHDTDGNINFQQYSGDFFRVGLLKERSSDVVFTSTSRNGLVVDLSGTRTHLTQMDGRLDETPTQRGQVCLIPMGMEVRFAWETHAHQQTSVTLEFESALLAAFLPEFENGRFGSGHLLPGNYADRPILAWLMRLLSREIQPHRRRGRLFADSLMRLVAYEVAASHWSTPMQRPMDNGVSDSRVKRAIEFVEANFTADISLSEISHASGLSLTQLTLQFQNHTGATPYSYVIDRRLREAVRLLRTTDMSIAQIAIETGFSDQQHLTRTFRARLQKTPAQVRKG